MVTKIIRPIISLCLFCSIVQVSLQLSKAAKEKRVGRKTIQKNHTREKPMSKSRHISAPPSFPNYLSVYVTDNHTAKAVDRENSMPLKTYSVRQIARYFLSLADPETNDISNLKLQKLCYYAQGLCSSMRGSPLFHERIAAWDHGPVVEQLYHDYKHYGSNTISPVIDFDNSEIEEPDRRALDAIHAYYGQFSAWRLRNMTHEDRPWVDAYHRGSNSEITLNELVGFFHPQISEEFAKNIYGKQSVSSIAQ